MLRNNSLHAVHLGSEAIPPTIRSTTDELQSAPTTKAIGDSQANGHCDILAGHIRMILAFVTCRTYQNNTDVHHLPRPTFYVAGAVPRAEGEGLVCSCAIEERSSGDESNGSKHPVLKEKWDLLELHTNPCASVSTCSFSATQHYEVYKLSFVLLQKLAQSS